MANLAQQEAERCQEDVSRYRSKKLERLKDMDFFILDNSIRESTVGQIRSHTLQNKIDIFKQIKKCGLRDIIVASFSHMTRVDDDFCQHLVDSGEDFTNLYSFSEVTEGLRNGRYDTEKIPNSMKKNKKYGLRHTVFEMDLANPDCDWGGAWTVSDQVSMLRKLFKWVRTEIFKDARILINLRDFSVTMSRAPQRLLEVVEAIASLPDDEKIFAFIYEDLGDSFPDELGIWTRSVRKVMNKSGWRDGRLLMHIHEQWDLQTAATLSCLEHGADGVWASLCEEGAAVGHASSSVTTMNLVRLGNKKVLERYNVEEMREAARKITKITTGQNPSPRQVLYGERALDAVFGFPLEVVRAFDINKFFGVEPVQRMNTLASDEMIRDHLVSLFGEHAQFTLEMGMKMKELMLEDLRSGRKEEYQSKLGLTMLFDRAGGETTVAMRDAIAEDKVHNLRHQELIDDIRQEWDKWDSREEVAGDGRLQRDSFYHGFLAPYFGCYRCQMTSDALCALDMDKDGYVDWTEFMVYIKWALRQYPKLESADDVIDVAFQKGLIPAMRDEQLKRKQ